MIHAVVESLVWATKSIHHVHLTLIDMAGQPVAPFSAILGEKDSVVGPYRMVGAGNRFKQAGSPRIDGCF
jgi:hypothetical protein